MRRRPSTAVLVISIGAVAVLYILLNRPPRATLAVHVVRYAGYADKIVATVDLTHFNGVDAPYDSDFGADFRVEAWVDGTVTNYAGHFQAGPTRDQFIGRDYDGVDIELPNGTTKWRCFLRCHSASMRDRAVIWIGEHGLWDRLQPVSRWMADILPTRDLATFDVVSPIFETRHPR